jgi:hypothetical protein
VRFTDPYAPEDIEARAKPKEPVEKTIERLAKDSKLAASLLQRAYDETLYLRGLQLIAHASGAKRLLKDIGYD